MKWFLLLAIATIVVANASAGSIWAILYDPLTSTSYGGTEGLFLNSSNGIWQSFTYDDFSAGARNASMWAINTTGNSTVSESTGSNIRFLRLTAGAAGNDLVNMTNTINLNRSQDVNITFNLIITPSLSELRVTNGIPGNSTLWNYLAPQGTDLSSRNAITVFFNFANHSLSYTQGGSLLNTVNVAAYSKLYIQIKAEQSSVAEFDDYYNATEQRILNETQLNGAQAFLFYGNTSGIGGSGNLTNRFVNVGSVPFGVSPFSFNIQNYWYNFSRSISVDGTYYYIVKNTTITNNASYFFTVFDEETFIPIKFTLTILNSSNTSILGGFTNFFWSNWTGIPNGAIFTTIDNSTLYFPRTYPGYFNNPGLLYPSYLNRTLYLLKSSGTSGTVLFNIVSSSGTGIPGALVTVQKQIAGNYVTVAESLTDSSGTVGIFLSQITQYKIIVSAVGYSSYTALLTPSSSSYTITLSAGTGNTTPGFFNNLTYSILPSSPWISNGSTSSANINFTVTSTDSSLSAFSMNLTLGNGTVLYAQTSNAAAGGVLAYPFNTTNMTGNITAVFRISRNGFTTDFTLVQVYQVVGNTNFGIQHSVDLINQYTTPWFRFLLAIILSLVTTIFISIYIGFGSGLATMAVLGWFATIGWVSMPFYIVVCLATIGLIATGRLNL